jgi:hypothetical protein
MTSNHDSSGSYSADDVLEDLRTIMQMAGEEYYGEQRMDLSHEVADTVRFAQASILWHERLTPQAELQVHLGHEHLPMVVGNVQWASEQFLCISNERHEYLVATEHILAVTGLASIGLANAPSPVTEHMHSMWLGSVLEDQESASWYLASNRVAVGECTRVGLDAVDVHLDALVMTLMLRHVVAIRISLRH